MTVIYCGGKIDAGDWRHEVAPNLRSVTYNGGWFLDRDARTYYETDWIDKQWKTIPTVYEDVDYIGPYFTGCDHACAHTGDHGFAEEPVCGYDCPHDLVKRLCLEAIGRANIFFAWLGGEEVCTAYGTLAELGYAKASGLTVVTAAPVYNYSLWFAHRMADLALLSHSPALALKSALVRLKAIDKPDDFYPSNTFNEIGAPYG